MKTQTESDAALRAMRVIRLAWIDERLDAETRGDAYAAAQAALNVNACDLEIRRLEKRDKTKSLRYELLVGLREPLAAPSQSEVAH